MKMRRGRSYSSETSCKSSCENNRVRRRTNLEQWAIEEGEERGETRLAEEDTRRRETPNQGALLKITSLGKWWSTDGYSKQARIEHHKEKEYVGWKHDGQEDADKPWKELALELETEVMIESGIEGKRIASVYWKRRSGNWKEETVTINKFEGRPAHTNVFFKKKRSSSVVQCKEVTA